MGSTKGNPRHVNIKMYHRPWVTGRGEKKRKIPIHSSQKKGRKRSPGLSKAEKWEGTYGTAGGRQRPKGQLVWHQAQLNSVTGRP